MTQLFILKMPYENSLHPVESVMVDGSTFCVHSQYKSMVKVNSRKCSKEDIQ